MSGQIKALLVDFDGTLTTDGRVLSEVYSRLHEVRDSGVLTFLITGRSAAWCECFCRCWPLDAVVGENGGLVYRMGDSGELVELYACPDQDERARRREYLIQAANKILADRSELRFSFDNKFRLTDVAIDIAEDCGLSAAQLSGLLKRITQLPHTSHVLSSIHLHLSYGSVTKAGSCLELLLPIYDLEESSCAFIGDSPNDEPMFAAFSNTFAVAGISRYLASLNHRPAHITTRDGGLGFCEATHEIFP